MGRMSKVGYYVRVIATVAAGLYAVAFVVFNARRTAEVWLFVGVAPDRAPTLVVIITTAVLSVALVWLLRELMRWRRRREVRSHGAGQNQKK